MSDQSTVNETTSSNNTASTNGTDNGAQNDTSTGTGSSTGNVLGVGVWVGGLGEGLYGMEYRVAIGTEIAGPLGTDSSTGKN